MTRTISENHVPVKTARGSVRTIKVGLLGLGTVGQNLCALIKKRRSVLRTRHGTAFSITCVLVRDLEKHRRNSPPGAVLTDDQDRFRAHGFDMVVEAMGGIEPAGALIRAFLEKGVPVVTANKALLAEQGAKLAALAAQHRTRLRFEASVAAGIPLIKVVEQTLHSTTISSVRAILNGTSNYIITCMAKAGQALPDALLEAKRLGFAEADPSLDLSGLDAAQKMTVLVNTLAAQGKCRCGFDKQVLEVSGLNGLLPGDFARARTFGYTIKPLAVADLFGPSPRGFVGPALVPLSHPLANVWNQANGVELTGYPLGTLFLSGPGAGGLPTAASLLDDMLALTQRPVLPDGFFRSLPESGPRPVEVPSITTRWYLSLSLKRTSPEDVLDYLSASGLHFFALREFDGSKAPVLAGLCSPCGRDQILRVEARLRAAGAIFDFRAFRVAEDRERKPWD